MFDITYKKEWNNNYRIGGEKMKQQKAKIILAFMAIIPLLLFSYQGQTTIGSVPTERFSSKEMNTKAIQTSSSEETIKKPNLEHNELLDITNTFMEMLVQDVDQQYKVDGMDTKEALIDKFKNIATAEVAEEYVSYYYEEKEDGLYIIPTETPPWLTESEPYQKENIGKNKMKITQQNQSDLYGDYTIEIELTYKKKWIITNIYHGDENNGTI